MIALDLTGRRFGELTVLRLAGRKRSYKLWECQCDCGEILPVSSRNLRQGEVHRCKMCRRVNLMGMRFFMLTVISPVEQPLDRQATKARWLCRCDCGKEIVTRTDSLRNGRSKSCGCWRVSLRLPGHGAVYNQALNRMVQGAAQRKLAWHLSRDEAIKLMSSDCHYCGTDPRQGRATEQDEIKINGIDRLDSSVGYTPDNVVPCCKWCNFAKNTMGYEEFRNWVLRVHRHWARAKAAA